MRDKLITLPDGYNGHTARFYAEPIAREGILVKLRCAEPGKEYMFRWALASHTDNERAFTMLEHAIDYLSMIGCVGCTAAIETLLEAHKAIGPCGQIPSWERV